MSEPDFSLLIIGINWPPETFLKRLINGLSERGIGIWVAGNTSPKESWQKKGNQHWIWSPSWNVPHWKRTLNLIFLLKNILGARKERIKLFFQLFREKSGFKSKIYLLYKILPFINVENDIIYFPWVYSAHYYLPWFKLIDQVVIVSLRGSMVNVYPHSKNENEKVSARLRTILNGADAVHCVSDDIHQTIFFRH